MIYIYYVHMHPIDHSERNMCYFISIRLINHIVAGIQIIHFKAFSFIPYNMMKNYCTLKLINR